MPIARSLCWKMRSAANGPHIQALMGYGMDFIISIKPVGNAPSFEVMHERSCSARSLEDEEILADGSGRGYRFCR